MALHPPPGPRYLLRKLPNFLLPFAVVLVISYVSPLNIPIWLLPVVCILSLPINFVLVTKWRQYRNERAADALGAQLPPVIEHSLPGGLDLMKDLQRDKEVRFPGYRFMKWVETYGPVCNLRLLFEDRLIVAEPEYVKTMLATDFASYEKGPELRGQLETLLGTGVFNSDGEMWKFHRGMTRPFFSREKISHFDIFDTHAEETLGIAKARLREGYPVDWQDLVSRFTLDCATTFLFGADVRSLSVGLAYPPSSHITNGDSQPEHPANVFSRAFLEAQTISSRRGRYGASWPLREFWGDKVATPMKVIDSFIVPLLHEALAKKQVRGQDSRKDTDDEDETLLSHLVNIIDDPKIIKDETINILLAGRDTTASTLTSAVYMLAEHPDIMRRLRSEVLDKIGMRRPTYDDIRDMKYLRAFINETLRLYPPVPANVRYSNKSTVWPSTVPGGRSLYIPAHTRILFSVLIMHRRKDLWGPDAAEFDPDRFLDERLQKYLVPNPFIFLPFNAGPRICLGQQFAYNETSFMLIRLLQQFSKFEVAQLEANPAKVPPPGWAESPLSNGKDSVIIKTHLTTFVDGGLWIKFEEATAGKEE